MDSRVLGRKSSTVGIHCRLVSTATFDPITWQKMIFFPALLSLLVVCKQNKMELELLPMTYVLHCKQSNWLYLSCVQPFYCGLVPKAAFGPVTGQIMTFSTVASCCTQTERNEMDFVPLRHWWQFKQVNGFDLPCVQSLCSRTLAESHIRSRHLTTNVFFHWCPWVAACRVQTKQNGVRASCHEQCTAPQVKNLILRTLCTKSSIVDLCQKLHLVP